MRYEAAAMVPLLARSLNIPAAAPSMMALFDVDCNVHLLAPHVANLLARARDVGVRAVFAPGSSLTDSAQPPLSEAVTAGVRVLRGAGVHPFEARLPPTSSEIAALEALLDSGAFAACGECGLDTSAGFPPLDAQRAWFQAHIAMAAARNLPLFTHERGAHDEFLRLLDANHPSKVMVHCFTGTPDELAAYNARGFYISISGVICRGAGEPADSVRRALQMHPPPLSRLCVETDAPYMGFPGCRGAGDRRHSPNVPAALPLVVAKLAEILNADAAELARSCTAAAEDFFRH